MKYRADIDGLRAIAVLLVVLHHLDLAGLSGGFVGVDIFFVISGFLITRIIFAETREQRFTISGFYVRRVRRIIPVLCVVVTMTAIASAFLIPVSELEEMSGSVVAMAAFVSNVFFWRHADYFSVAAELKPLLHTWSLSVEEQYYLIFPLFMIATRRLSQRGLAALLGVLAVVSFAVSVYTAQAHPLAGFYLVHARAWELLLGCLLAVQAIPPLSSRLAASVLSLSGLAMIVSSAFLLRKGSVFPGVNALHPCLGTVLVIYGNSAGATMVGSLLSNPVMCYIGSISYSLYLWHWPVLVIARSNVMGELTAGHKAAVLAIAFALSAASYRWIETPFRRGKLITEATLVRAASGSALGMALVGVALWAYVGNSRYHERHGIAAIEKARLEAIESCFGTPPSPSSLAACSFGDREAQRAFLFWGDSQASAALPAFEAIAREQGWRGIRATVKGCPPLFDVFRRDAPARQLGMCSGESGRNVRAYLEQNPVDVVVLVARWSMYETGWIKNGRLQEATGFLSDATTEGTDAATSAIVLARAIRSSIRELTQRLRIPVIIVAQVPELPRDPDAARVLSDSARRDAYLAQRAFTDSVFREFEGDERVSFVDPVNAFCGEHVCSGVDAGTLLYEDDNHVSFWGAMRLQPLLAQAFPRWDGRGSRP